MRYFAKHRNLLIRRYVPSKFANGKSTSPFYSIREVFRLKFPHAKQPACGLGPRLADQECSSIAMRRLLLLLASSFRIHDDRDAI